MCYGDKKFSVDYPIFANRNGPTHFRISEWVDPFLEWVKS